jgi:hypothetical protein
MRQRLTFNGSTMHELNFLACSSAAVCDGGKNLISVKKWCASFIS